MGIGLAIDALRAHGWQRASAFQAAFALFAVGGTLAYAWFLWRGGRSRHPALDNPRFRPAYVMPGLLVIAHAPLASALRSLAEHVYPDCSGSLAALDVSAGCLPSRLKRGCRDAEAIGDGEVLILTDVFGATPCNIAQRLADGVHIKVVTGVNVPMLWRSLCYRSEPIDSLVARALAGGVQGAMQVSPTRPQNQARSPPNSMLKATVTISNKLGLHARASAKLTKLAGSFACDVHMSRNGRRINAKSIMAS